MKTVLIVAILLLNTLLLKAQRITYSDLKYIITHRVAQVDDYFSKRGYSFGGVDTFGVDRNHYSYSYIKRGKTSKSDKYVGKEAVNNVFCKSSFYTNSQSEYLQFKSDIIKNGFKFSETRLDKSGSLINVYSKGVYSLEIWIRRNKPNDFTEYNIWLINKEQVSD